MNSNGADPAQYSPSSVVETISSPLYAFLSHCSRIAKAFLMARVRSSAQRRYQGTSNLSVIKVTDPTCPRSWLLAFAETTAASMIGVVGVEKRGGQRRQKRLAPGSECRSPMPLAPIKIWREIEFIFLQLRDAKAADPQQVSHPRNTFRRLGRLHCSNLPPLPKIGDSSSLDRQLFLIQRNIDSIDEILGDPRPRLAA